jgi:hypothetical protein
MSGGATVVPYEEDDLIGPISYDTWEDIRSQMVYIEIKQNTMRERMGANYQINYRRLSNDEINALTEGQGRAYVRYLMTIRRGDERNALNQMNRFMRNNPPTGGSVLIESDADDFSMTAERRAFILQLIDFLSANFPTFSQLRNRYIRMANNPNNTQGDGERIIELLRLFRRNADENYDSDETVDYR